jgi:PAS domain-containing protein
MLLRHFDVVVNPSDGRDFVKMSGQKNSDTDLYRREKQRQEPEDILRQLWRVMEQSADLVIITDRSGATEYVNPAFAVLTGYLRL